MCVPLLSTVAALAAMPTHTNRTCGPDETVGPSNLHGGGGPLLARGRLAVCITGLAVHGDNKHKFPLTNRRTYGPMASFLRDLRAGGLRADAHLRLDLHTGDRGFRDANKQCGPPGPPAPHASLQPMLDALAPSSFELYNANGTSCFCDDHPQLCACSVALLAEWTIDLGLTLAPLPVRSRGIGVCWAEEWGEVDRAHPAHDVSQLGNCAVG